VTALDNPSPPGALQSALDVERNQLGALLEQAPAFIAWLRGPDHVFAGANEAYYQLVGHRDLIGKPVVNAVPEAVALGLVSALDRVLATGEPFVAEGMRLLLRRAPRAEPEERFTNFVYQPLVEADGTRSGIFCHGVDVTEQVRATNALRESEAHHRRVLDSLPVIVYRAEPVHPYESIYVSAAIESLGYTHEEWLARPDMWSSRLHPDDRVRVQREARECYERAESMNCQYRMLAKDGSVRWFHDRGDFVPDERGERCIWQGIMLDITAQREAEDALRKSEARHRLIFDEAGIGMAVCDLTGRIEQANAALCEFLGYERDELAGMNYRDFSHPDELELDRQESEALLAGEIARFTHERRYVRKDGSLAWGLLTVVLLRDATGEPARRIAQVQDITKRKDAERTLAATQEALRESDARHRHIVANTPGMVYQFAYRPDGTKGYTFVSEAARTIFGIDPEAALRDPEALLGLVHPEEVDELRRHARAVAEAGGEFRWEGRVILASGEERYIEVVARDQHAADGTLLSDGLVVDVTGRRRTEQALVSSQEQFRQAQKMEAVGRLAGGIAHDFNNLLTVIKASTGFLMEELDSADPRREDARQIAEAAERAARLTRQLLAFSRKQILDPRVLDLNTVVENLRPMLARLIGEDITIDARLAPRPGSIMADVGQLEQVLINLAVNARDAMPEGGRITIETAEVMLDEPYAADCAQREHCTVVPGQYVMLAVSDTGAGMPPEVRSRVFEPFYTTKGAGKGTGLGLSTVYGIVKQSGGHVWVYSEAGEGTVFKLYFPRLEQAATAPLRRTGEFPARGSETVLLVEDEAAVRQLARRILERQGYRVLESNNGRDALARATAHEGRIDLILTDVVMPEMSGRALVERLSAVRPNAAIVYMSGYTDDDVLRRGMLEPGSMFIQKPFNPRALLRIVRDALTPQSSSALP
jgi:PAS domain S-box-containing protein